MIYKMENNYGYIYIRRSNSYDLAKVCKLGKTSNIPERDNVYSTSEFDSGDFTQVYRVEKVYMSKLEKELQQFLKEYHRYKGRGTEFYSIEIIDKIEEYLQNQKYDYISLSKEDISKLKRLYRIKQIKKIFIESKNTVIKLICNMKQKIIPNEQQQYVLDNIEEYYKPYDIGKIVWACGCGKALLGILIVEKLDYKSVVIGVPSMFLQNQMKNEILRIFPNKTNILFVGGDGDKEDNIQSTTNRETISSFLQVGSNECKFIITTYNSCHLLVDNNFQFDYKIGDEAHHLVGIEDIDIEKSYTLFHKILSKKTLFMTATEKVIETKTDKLVYSMDNETIFGKCIDKKSVHWAIENKKITDYDLLLIKSTEEEVNNIISGFKIKVENKELFISVFMVLNSMQIYKNLTHILVYTNNTYSANLAEYYINELLETDKFKYLKNDMYNKSLHSKSDGNIYGEIYKFENSVCGIISCVHILGEGFDLPRLNGVCFAENMLSDIRIVQCALRPNRLEKHNPNKIAYIIIPYFDYDDWENDHKSFYKCRTIISKIRNVDETIEQKIKGLSIKKPINKKQETIENNYDDFTFDENTDELQNIKIRLRHSKTLGSKFTEEQNEYNYMRLLNKKKSIQSKNDYEKHKMNITNPEEYFKLKGVWTDWYDFLGVDTKKFIQCKENWINFCKEQNVKSIKEYDILCSQYEQLPKNPSDFYSHFTNFQNELGIHVDRR